MHDFIRDVSSLLVPILPFVMGLITLKQSRKPSTREEQEKIINKYQKELEKQNRRISELERRLKK